MEPPAVSVWPQQAGPDRIPGHDTGQVRARPMRLLALGLGLATCLLFVADQLHHGSSSIVSRVGELQESPARELARKAGSLQVFARKEAQEQQLRIKRAHALATDYLSLAASIPSRPEDGRKEAKPSESSWKGWEEFQSSSHHAGPRTDRDVSAVQSKSVGDEAKTLHSKPMSALKIAQNSSPHHKIVEALMGAQIHTQKLQDFKIIRDANGNIDFPGEHFPPVHIFPEGGNSSNATNSTDDAEDDDDYDQDRTKDSVWDQILRTPFTEHVERTIQYNTQDEFKPVADLRIQNASPKKHKVKLFDDDRDIHDSSELDAPSEKPPPLSERDPDYYPGGDFVDEMKNYTDAEEGFQGGFGDNMVEKAAPVAGTVSVVAERNFEGVADDENVDMNVSAHKVHPRAHMGDEFDAGGAFEDVLRAPGAELDPWNKDRFVFVPEPVEEAAKAQQKEPLEPSDVDVPTAQAALPEDAAELNDLGLETSAPQVTDPSKAEFQYRFGLMSDFQDRNVDVKPVLDGAMRLATKWAQGEEDAAARMFDDKQAAVTVPLVVDEGDDAHFEE